MASQRQWRANRRNAQRSTGPRSAKGKARSRLNAQRHGLAAKLSPSASAVSDEVMSLANTLAGSNPDPVSGYFWRIVAAAELELLRVDAAVNCMISSQKGSNGSQQINADTYGN